MNKFCFALLALLLAACADPLDSASYDLVTGVHRPTRPAPQKHVAYPQLCDAKLALIEARCQREARCGNIGQDEVDQCVVIYATYFGWSGCGYVPLYDDATYDRCFAEMAAFECGPGGDEPLGCDGIFEPGDLASP